MCGNGLDFERASERPSGVEWNGQSVSRSVSQSVVKSVHQSKAKLFFPMYKKEEENKERKNIYILPYIPHVLLTLPHKKFSISNNMIL